MKQQEEGNKHKEREDSLKKYVWSEGFAEKSTKRTGC